MPGSRLCGAVQVSEEENTKWPGPFVSGMAATYFYCGTQLAQSVEYAKEPIIAKAGAGKVKQKKTSPRLPVDFCYADFLTYLISKRP